VRLTTFHTGNIVSSSKIADQKSGSGHACAAFALYEIGLEKQQEKIGAERRLMVGRATAARRSATYNFRRTAYKTIASASRCINWIR